MNISKKTLELISKRVGDKFNTPYRAETVKVEEKKAVVTQLTNVEKPTPVVEEPQEQPKAPAVETPIVESEEEATATLLLDNTNQ